MREFTQEKNIELNSLVEISSFTSSYGEVDEYMVMIKGTDCTLCFEKQLENAMKSFSTLTGKCNGAEPVFARFFLSDIANQSQSVELLKNDYPLCAFSVIGQPPLDGTKIAILIYLQTAMSGSKSTDSIYCHQHGSYRHLWSTSAYNKAANSEYQMRLLFNEYVMQLANQNCRLSTNCIRTWIFVQNIDVNYPAVVKARNEVFASQNLTTDTHYIASTGIQGNNANPAVSVQMDGYAVDGLKDGQVKYLYAPDYLNRTSDYGVSFERGTSVMYGDRIHTFISGTASIDNKGEILYKGDVTSQGQRACENVEALLKEGGCSMEDVMHIIVYLRDVADYINVRTFYDENFPATPKVYLLAPVCRPGWLVEMECIAIKEKADHRFDNF